ncbi:MAG: cupredoxin domain-containing protein [Burkholderiales bacterium]
MKNLLSALVILGAVALSAAALADEVPVFRLAIANREFAPRELSLPVGVKLKLEIRNDDTTPAEFESNDLSREVVVPGHAKVVIYLGPLEPGRYRFFNDFNPAAEGWVVVGKATK